MTKKDLTVFLLVFAGNFLLTTSSFSEDAFQHLYQQNNEDPFQHLYQQNNEDPFQHLYASDQEHSNLQPLEVQTTSRYDDWQEPDYSHTETNTKTFLEIFSLIAFIVVSLLITKILFRKFKLKQKAQNLKQGFDQALEDTSVDARGLTKKTRIIIVLNVFALLIGILTIPMGIGAVILISLLGYWGYRFIKNDISFLKMGDE